MADVISIPWTASEMVENVEAGTLCRGIYFTDNIEEVLTEREPVIKVKNELTLQGAKSRLETYERLFMSEREADTFESNIEKYSSSHSPSHTIWGLSLQDEFFKETLSQDETSQQDDGFVAAIDYELVPIASVSLSVDKVELRQEVITALQEIEKSVKLSHKPKGHFQEFFRKYGSHFSKGVVEFGGILLSRASCKHFPEIQLPLKRNQAKQASELALKQIFEAEKAGSSPVISVSSKKIGGAPEATSKVSWTESLKNTNCCRVIRQSSPPEPIWRLIEKDREHFNTPLLLAVAMRKEFKQHANPERQTEYLNLGELKQNINMRLELCDEKDEKTMMSFIKELEVLRNKFSVSEEDWREEVLYSAEVQDILGWSAQFIKTTADTLQKEQLSVWMKKILDPMDKINTKHFSKVNEIISVLKYWNRLEDHKPFEIRTITDLPDILEMHLAEVQTSESGESMFRSVQERLEATIKHWSKGEEYKYFYILCVTVLGLKGFKITPLCFEFTLYEEDFQDIISLLRENIGKFGSLTSRSKKQAYLLHLAADCNYDICNSVTEMLKTVPEGISRKVKKIQEESRKVDHKGLDMDRFKKSLGLFLEGRNHKSNLNTLAESIRSQLNFIENHTPMQDLASGPSGKDPGKSLETLLDVLEMKTFYPQKLTYDDVITLTSDMMTNSDKKPTTLPELPWFFLRQIVALDSSTRENSHLTSSWQEFSDESSESSDSDSDDSDSSELEAENGDRMHHSSNTTDGGNKQLTSLHILELIHIIFLCADDFLRQELVDKMAKCQYAVPFILPFQDDTGKGTQHLVLHWSLKPLFRLFYDKGVLVHRPLVDMEADIISCLSFGEETSWKSRFMNELLCPQQQTFWHQGLKGGNCEQKISQGMVEAAWYLPGKHKDDQFTSPVSFLNCRGNALNSPDLSNLLINSSSVTCCFMDSISHEFNSFLSSRQNHENMIIVVLHKKEEKRMIKAECKELRKTLKLKKKQIITMTADDTNFQEVCEKLKRSLRELLSQQTAKKSLEELVNQIRGKPGFQADDEKSRRGHDAALKILKDVDDINARKIGSAKREILPSHSDLEVRRNIAALEKELCRQRKRKENTRIQDHAHDIKGTKLRLQIHQLQMPLSDSFKHFVMCLFRLSRTDRKYFLQILKMGLNERSQEMLQPFYEQYDKTRMERDGKEKEKKLKMIDEQISHGSLGLEHFVREIAVVYENMVALKEMSKTDILDQILDKLAALMAEILMEGTSLEIMDGDTVHVPILFLKAVLNKVENSTTTRLFKVSVLGAQSCGKSTILNTAFGLNFPVSSGRCTRGAYMQLVRVDEKLRQTLKSDYILVIDSEGLMSRLRSSSSDYDNELATFVIGLSDLTLVVIKGEGNEMQDVLPLAIHVFLRMNMLGEHQACHFVHQNMGAVGDMQKTATEIDVFVRDLNDKTLAAAMDVDQSDRYTKFTDVLQYDEKKDNTYLPGLWDGSLPMAKTKTHYSHTVQELKSDILQHVEQFRNRKAFGTFSDFTKRIHELWEAIKYENFVFSFQNVLAVEAYTQLSRLFDDVQWKVKRDVREMIQREQYGIENEWRSADAQASLAELIEDKILHITKHILAAVGDATKKIMHYFQCSGCDTCNDEVKNRHLLANHEKEFEDELSSLQKTLIKELEKQMETLEILLKANRRIIHLSTKMDDILKTKVHEAIARREKGVNDVDSCGDVFAKIWREAAGDILRTVRHAEDVVDIKAVIQATITRLLGKDGQFYVWKIEDPENVTSATHRDGIKPNMPSFTVKLRHLQCRRIFLSVPEHFEVSKKQQDVKRLSDHASRIIYLSRAHFDVRMCPAGKKFNNKDGEMLFKDVIKQIDDIRDERFRTTTDFKIDLLLYIEKLAVPAFTEMHEKYCRESSPKALLGKKRESYYNMFMVKMGQFDATVKFCENVLQDMILQNIEDQLSCTELLHDLRDHCGQTFRDIKSLQASIMIDLYRQNSPKKYIEYINKYEMVVKKRLQDESISYFEKDERFQSLARIKLDQIIGIIQDSVDKTCSGTSNVGNLIEAFFSNIKALKMSNVETAAFLDLDIPDKSEFGAIVYRELQGPIKRNILQKIRAFRTENKLREKGFFEFLFTEVVGCSARCPFCKVPCDSHSGGKRGGNHASTLHRPAGLGAVCWTSNFQLVIEDCRMQIASQEIQFNTAAFLDDDDDDEDEDDDGDDEDEDDEDGDEEDDDEWTLYREYTKVFPDWTIQGDSDPDTEKYWKWVFAQHNKALAEYYSTEKADVPYAWYNYTKEEITKDFDEYYGVKVDL